jgi:hypothetical protein
MAISRLLYFLKPAMQPAIRCDAVDWREWTLPLLLVPPKALPPWIESPASNP